MDYRRLERSGSFARGAVGDFLEAAEGCVYAFGVRERLDQVGGDHDQVGAFLHAVVILAAHGLEQSRFRGVTGSASAESTEFFVGILCLGLGTVRSGKTDETVGFQMRDE